MPDVYVKIDPTPSKVAGGINLDIGVCYQMGKGKEKCEMVDRLEFDKRDVDREIPHEVMDMLVKSVSGDYWKDGCKRLGLPIKDGRCGKPVAGQSMRAYVPEKKTPEPSKGVPATPRTRRK